MRRNVKGTWGFGWAALFAMSALGAQAGCAHRASAPGDASLEARRRLAHELVSRADWPSAFAYVDALHRDRPQDADVLTMRATIYRERGLLDEAEADLREAIHAAPDFAEAHAALGIVSDLRHRNAKAETEHKAAVGLAPENPAYLNNLGFSLFLHGKLDDAIAAYQRAARLGPTVRRTRTNLGFAYAAKGDLARAAREFEMGGTPVEAKINLGFAYERRGDMTNAYALYVEAAKLDPRSRRARANLVHAAGALGRPVPRMDVPEAATPAGGAEPPESADNGDAAILAAPATPPPATGAPAAPYGDPES